MSSKLNARLLRMSVGLAAAALFAGAAVAQTSSQPQRGGTAIVAIGAEPGGLNPVITTASPELISGCNAYEGLVVLNVRTNKFEPGLAESWTVSPDGKTYTFKLRKTEWHDGTPFTSEDVRYTILEVASKIGPTFSAQAGKAIEAVNTPDPQTVEMKLKEPYGPFLLVLTCAFSGAILPAHLFKGTDPRTNPVTQKPVGTGPFKFSEWVRGDHITMVRNDKYWDTGKPYLDSVIVKIMPNGGSRTKALLAGEVDYIPTTYFPASDSKTAEASPNLRREPTGLPPNQLFAFFNLKRAPLSDVKVRHALLTATDRDYIYNNAFYGLGAPGRGPWTTLIEWAHDPAIDYDKSHPFDPDKAGRMLEEAGYKADANGIRLKLTLTYDSVIPERSQAASAMKAMWRRAGVDLVLAPLESAVLMPRVHQEANFDVYMTSYASYADPAIGVGRAYLSSTIGTSFGNASGYSNPEVDALFDKASKLTTYEERGAVYKQIEPILMRDLPAMLLHSNRGYDVTNRKLVGAWGYSGNARMGNAWFEK